MDSVAQPRSPLPRSPRTTTEKSGTNTILLGKYQLGRLLGRGSFAKVNQAHCIATGSAVAVKIIDKKKTVDAGMEPRIIREIDAMRRLHHHPNILKINEVMATKSKIYLVMELATGGELFNKIVRHGRLPESEARRYFQQLTSALRFCHQNGVAHRDVKPQNLLLDQDGNLKVADFGLSALPEHIRNGSLHTACGTPAYTAPEIVARRGYDGAKADAWSCGVILFVLLAGRVPFDDSNIPLMYRKIQRREYIFPSWISKPARSIIHQLLDPNPETRMSLCMVERTNWFRKSLESSNCERSMFNWGNPLHEYAKSNKGSITAFDIISLSSGLDLSGMLEEKKRKMKRFTSRVSAEGVTEKARCLGKKLGYKVKEIKGGGTTVALGREGAAAVVIVVEAAEIAAGTVVVEVKVVEGDEEDERWDELKKELEVIVHSWHYDVI